MSNIEHGRVNITIAMLRKIADNMGIELPYLACLPHQSRRQDLIEHTRSMSDAEVDALLLQLGPARALPPPRSARRVRHSPIGVARRRSA